MDRIEFDVELHTAELYRFTMRHTYWSISGVFSLLVSVGCLLVALINLNTFQTMTTVALFVIASLFTVVQPLMLWVKCAAQVKQNKSINAPLHYIVNREGIMVQQKEQEAEVKWYDVQKAVYTQKAIYLYMSVVRAFIFPMEQCDGQFEQLCELTKQQIEKYKDYVPKEAEDIQKEEADE